MKKYFIIIFLLALLPSHVFADSTVEERVASLENTVANQNNAISFIQRELATLKKQNLALKQALVLEPTIDEFKTEELTYRLHEAVGDSLNKSVHLIMTVTNDTDYDISHFQMSYCNKYVDEKGNQNKNLKQFDPIIGGTNDGTSINQLYSGVPTKLDVYISDFDPTSQYLKIVYLDVYEGANDKDLFTKYKRNCTFRNIPINWH